jgi:predicted ATPase/DNA-binding CsgD family transcriptional regulator
VTIVEQTEPGSFRGGPSRERPPHLRSTFVGRQRDLEALRALLLNPSVRLVTISGPSGVGKSRLATQLADTLDDSAFESVLFLPLATVTEPDRVLLALARLIDVRDDVESSLLAGIREQLRGRRTLIILDNFEHLIGASVILTELLSCCDDLTLLVTSRIPLRITAEHEYLLGPLPLPKVHEVHLTDSLLENEAVALFVSRARAVSPAFALTEENAPSITEICRRLDGLPLAIELAAARIKILSPQALLARLSNRLQLLTGGPRDVPARLQTMRDAIAWSYDLLSPEQRAVFRHVSVFSGGFSLEAATTLESFASNGKAIASADSVHNRLPATDLFDALALLVDNSIVLSDRDAQPEPRFVILETIREYGLEQLDRHDELETYRSRQAAISLQLALTAQEHLWGPRSREWLARLEQEHDNLRAALNWALDNDPSMALKMVANLWWFWQTRGFLTEGRDWIRRALQVATEAPSANVIDSMLGGGFLAVMQGDPQSALALQATGLRLATESSDQLRVGQMHYLSSFALGGSGEHARAVEFAEQALELMQACNCDRWIPFALNRLGIELSEVGEEERGLALFQDAHDLWLEQGNEWGIVTALVNLALGARNRGEYHKAVESLVSCLPLAYRQGDTWGVAETCHALAGLSALLGDPVMAARFQGARDRVKLQIGLKLQRYIDPVLRDGPGLEGVIGSEQFNQAIAEGHSASIDDLIGWGTTLLTTSSAGGHAPESVRPSRRSPAQVVPAAELPDPPLSARELEVLRLMADGLSSREIGERLFISPRTATTHVGNIFAKLDVDSRASAVTKAFRLGLV